MIRIVLLGLFFYFLYRFVVRFLIPVLRVTSAARKQMRNMQQGSANTEAPKQPRPARKGEYIEFEEVKS